ncbi:MAG: serine/threonine-protein kinase [Pseudomonadota bacterium]|nr:serine/threonine-protein kinase [Pseudomonadota bacterium]
MSSFGDYPVTPARVPTPAGLVAGRYALGSLLGTGAFGAVHEARDLVTGATVAVKLLRAPGLRRREAAALRGLHLPGVVRLLDEGEEEGVGFLVMERIEGTPFPPDPGVGGMGWEDVREGFDALLQTLEAIHATGAVHLDLKPSNLLATPDGGLVILDFGLAGYAPAIGGAGNRRYAAPEQLLGAPVDRRADLYAVGALLWEALSGRHPSAGGEPPGGDGMKAALRSLTAFDPDSRPGTARAARLLLGADVPPMPFPKVLTRGQLRDLFVGPERVLHLPSDAAEMAWRRAGGNPARVQEELEAWLSAGFAHLREGRICVTREDLDRLDDGAWMLDRRTGVRHVATVPFSDGAVDIPAVHRILDEMLARGRQRAARALAAHAFALCSAAAERLDIAGRWTELAVGECRRPAFDPVLHVLGRMVSTPAVQALENLCRAGILVSEGAGSRALALLAALTPFAAPNVEQCRLRLRVQAAGRIGAAAEEAELASVRASGARLPEGRLDAWLGRLRYVQGRFGEAAVLEARAARDATTAISRVSSLLNASSAWLELGHVREGVGGAREARRIAREGRMCHHEGKAEWLLRAFLYRCGDPGEVDDELVAATAALELPYLLGLVALNEGAVAWRRGDDPLALAHRAAVAWRSAGQTSGAILAESLCVAAGGGDVDAVWASAMALPEDDVSWQALGLLALSRPTGPWTELARAQAARAVRPHLRRDVLAPCEVLQGITSH